MKPSVPYIEAKFDEFNTMIFGGALPRIPVSLGKAASYVGLCTFKSRRRPFRPVEYYDFRLRFSSRFDLPEPELEDTIIHEMIHYHIRLRGIKDTSAHGKVFRQMMEDINTRYGRHITVSHRTTKEQREALVDRRPRLRVVAIVSFTDGRQGLKQLPPAAPRVAAWHRALTLSGKVSGIEYYLVTDPWFNRYPTSSAFNVLFVPISEVRIHLSGAPMTVRDLTAQIS